MKIKHRYLYLFLLVIVSCTKDTETNENSSSNNGTSTPDSRNVYVGTWVCNENSQTFGTTTYSIDISKHSSITTRVVASNFYNLGFANSNAQFEISGSNITIIQQTISGYDVIGNGNLVNSSTINLSYTTNDGSGIDSVSAVYTKTN